MESSKTQVPFRQLLGELDELQVRAATGGPLSPFERFRDLDRGAILVFCSLFGSSHTYTLHNLYRMHRTKKDNVFACTLSISLYFFFVFFTPRDFFREDCITCSDPNESVTQIYPDGTGTCPDSDVSGERCSNGYGIVVNDLCVCDYIESMYQTYDQLMVRYSGCELINRYVFISMCRDCKDLKFLQNLKRIAYVYGDGAPNDYALDIVSNSELKSLDGLENLFGHLQSIQIEDNDILTSVEALQGVTRVYDEIYIRNNPLLVSLHGLHNIEETASLYVTSNSMLRTLEGVLGLVSVDEIMIARNPSLWSISGLRNLEHIEDVIYIRGSKITSLAEVGRYITNPPHVDVKISSEIICVPQYQMSLQFVSMLQQFDYSGDLWDDVKCRSCLFSHSFFFVSYSTLFLTLHLFSRR